MKNVEITTKFTTKKLNVKIIWLVNFNYLINKCLFFSIGVIFVYKFHIVNLILFLISLFNLLVEKQCMMTFGYRNNTLFFSLNTVLKCQNICSSLALFNSFYRKNWIQRNKKWHLTNCNKDSGHKVLTHDVACHLFPTNFTYVYFSPFILPCGICVYGFV